MNVYEIITNRITEQLEKGVIPWKKTWTGGIEGMPQNFITKKAYRGINPFLLMSMGYSSPYWMTFNQAKAKSATVKKGEKGTPVIFWNWTEKTNEAGKVESIPFLKYYTVFNADQVEGLNLPVVEGEVKPVFNPIMECEKIVEGMPLKPVVAYGGDRACYAPSTDKVCMPEKIAFISEPEYYGTLFHELIHSTKHESRLNRKDDNGKTSHFGNETYSKEELVAEFGAAFLCGVSGIETTVIENQAAYIQGWLKRLKDDSKVLVTAAAQAQKAADYILNKKAIEEV